MDQPVFLQVSGSWPQLVDLGSTAWVICVAGKPGPSFSLGKASRLDWSRPHLPLCAGDDLALLQPSPPLHTVQTPSAPGYQPGATPQLPGSPWPALSQKSQAQTL